MLRRTRIVATLGPATDRPGVLEKMLELGLDVARINFSHGTAEAHQARVARLRELAKQAGRTVAVLADLPGPKLRVLLKDVLTLTLNQLVTIALKADAAGDFHLTEPEFMTKAKPGHRVLLDDGRLQARLTACARDQVTLKIEVGGQLLPNKGINLPD